MNSHRAELGVGVVGVVGQNGRPAGAGGVDVVAGGPAAKAGVSVGEVVTSVDNTPVRSTADLSRILAATNPGRSVPLTVVNPQGRTTAVTVTLGRLPGS